MLSLNCEEDAFILGLMPVIFKINLNLIILQGKENEEKCDSIMMNTFNSKYENIFLLNCFNGYSIIYTGDLVDVMKANEIEDKYLEAENATQERVTVIKGSKCINCNKKKETLKFSHLSDFLICKACVQKYINSLILKRVKDFIKENLRNKECKL